PQHNNRTIVLPSTAVYYHRLYQPQHPHSFPTRRSSDLTTTCRSWSSTCAHPATSSARFQASRWARSSPRECDDRGMPAFSAETRSEEHTSELQSREKLVCRLLLEKKISLQNPLNSV